MITDDEIHSIENPQYNSIDTELLKKVGDEIRRLARENKLLSQQLALAVDKYEKTLVKQSFEGLEQFLDDIHP